MIVFAHTKFRLVRIQRSGVKRGGGICPPRSERVFSNPGPDRVKAHSHNVIHVQSL